MLAERMTTASKNIAFLVPESSHASPFLRTDLPIRAVDLITVLYVRGTLSPGIAFEDHGAVQDVSPQREVQMGSWVIGEAERLHEGKGVDGCKHFGGWGRGTADGDGACQGWMQSRKIGYN